MSKRNTSRATTAAAMVRAVDEPKRETTGLTMVTMTEDEIEKAERIARRLGYTQTAYTSTSALFGLFCLRDRRGDKAGCVILTKELGFMFVSDLEDLNIDGRTL